MYQFTCKRCGVCCGEDPGFVYLSKKDLESLCQFVGLSEVDFTEKYCRWVDYYGGREALSLKEKARYYCIFFDNGCTLYEARPVQCRTYPFWPWVIDAWDKASAKNASEEDKKEWESLKCPGMGSGDIYTKDEALFIKHEYLVNEIITRERSDIFCD